MISLSSYIVREENCTPGNTLGAGDPVMTNDGGSEPLVTGKVKLQKKKTPKHAQKEEE